MSPKPHVEIAAVIPDEQGRIVIGKRKGKEGTGMMEIFLCSSLDCYDRKYLFNVLNI